MVDLYITNIASILISYFSIILKIIHEKKLYVKINHNLGLSIPVVYLKINYLFLVEKIMINYLMIFEFLI